MNEPLFFMANLVNRNVTFPKGSSRIEPGAVPLEDLTIEFKTLTDFALQCGQSRLWSGVHFQDAIDNIKQVI